MPELLKRIIVLTAVAQNTLNTLSEEAQVWRVIRKPFDIDDLLRCVADCAAQQGSRLEM